LQALLDELRSARRRVEADRLLQELEREGLHAVLNQHWPVLRALASPERREEPATSDDSEPQIVKAKAGIVQVDLFV
jgi:hypothetical protein